MLGRLKFQKTNPDLQWPCQEDLAHRRVAPGSPAGQALALLLGVALPSQAGLSWSSQTAEPARKLRWKVLEDGRSRAESRPEGSTGVLPTLDDSSSPLGLDFLPGQHGLQVWYEFR